MYLYSKRCTDAPSRFKLGKPDDDDDDDDDNDDDDDDDLCIKKVVTKSEIVV